MGASSLRRAIRGVLLVLVGLILAGAHPDRIGAQGSPMRWDGVLEHISASGGWWGTLTGPAITSRHPVSHDGRWIVFRADIPNDPYPASPTVFRHDRMNGQTEMLFGAAITQAPVLSGDGHHVTFQSCDAWMRTDGASICDIYLVDLTNWRIVNASTAVDGTESTDASDEPMLSETGRFVVFRTKSPTLVPSGAAAWQIVVRDRDADGNGIYDEPGGV